MARKAPISLILDLGQEDIKERHYLKYKGVPLRVVITYPGMGGNVAINSKIVSEAETSYDETSNIVKQELSITMPESVLASDIEVIYGETIVHIMIGK